MQLTLPQRLARLRVGFDTCVWIALAASVLLYAPMLFADFWLDDWIHLAVLENSAATLGSAPWDLYVFADGTREGLAHLQARGQVVWWATQDYHLAFLRPLSSGLLWIDHQLFGRHAAGYAAHSMLWHLALVAAFARLVRPLLPAGTAGLAAILFAIDGAHAGAVGWIAARALVVSATFALLALDAHVRGRATWANVLSLLALAAGESGLAAPIFIIAYEIAGPRGRWFRALPALGLALAYVALHHALGYGVSGSGVYVDPVHDPMRFLAEAPLRVAALLGNLLLDAPAEFIHLLPASAPWLAALGVASAAAFAAGLRSLWPGLQVMESSAIRWTVLGSLVTLLLHAGALTGGRTLVMPAVGAAVLCATMLRRLHVLAWRPSGLGLRRQRAAQWSCVLLAGLFFLVGPLVIEGRLAVSRTSATQLRAAADAAERIAPRADLVIVRAAGADLGIGWYPGFRRPQQRATWLLSPTSAPLRVTRTGSRTLELDSAGRDWLDFEFATIARPRDRPFRVGEEVQLEGLRVRVLAVREGALTRAEFEFTRDLEGPTLAFATAVDGTLRAFALPAVGASVLLPQAQVLPGL